MDNSVSHRIDIIVKIADNFTPPAGFLSTLAISETRADNSIEKDTLGLLIVVGGSRLVQMLLATFERLGRQPRWVRMASLEAAFNAIEQDRAAHGDADARGG